MQTTRGEAHIYKTVLGGGTYLQDSVGEDAGETDSPCGGVGEQPIDVRHCSVRAVDIVGRGVYGLSVCIFPKWNVSSTIQDIRSLLSKLFFWK
jgi:hypothetical protein